LSALRGEKREKAVASCVTQVGTVQAMEKLGIFWPEAHRDPEKMVELGASLLRSIVELGVMHVHFNVVDVNVLLEAQKDPERYRHLVVRVAGYSAYFVDLTKEVQEEIIRRYRAA